MAELDVEALKRETYWGNVIGYRPAIIAALEDRDRLRAALNMLKDAWAVSWDCSRDPGHSLMEEAFKGVNDVS